MALSFIRAEISLHRNSLLRFFANVSTMKVIYVKSSSPSFFAVNKARVCLEIDETRNFRRILENCPCDVRPMRPVVVCAFGIFRA